MRRADDVTHEAVPSRALVAMGAIILAGAALRFATLSQGVWFDEAVTVRDLGGNLAHLLGSVSHNELSPPLYYVCLWLWRHAFGSSAQALRMFSALAGTLTIPVAFAVARRLVGQRTAIIVALLAACSPIMLYYSQELRPYALLVLLCSLGLLAFVAMLQAPRRLALSLWVVCCTLALACHYFAALAVLPQAAVLLRQACRGHALRVPTAAALGTVGLASAALGLLLHFQLARSYHFVLAQISSPFVFERFDAQTAAAGNGRALAQELLVGPGGPFKAATTLALLGFVLLALVNVLLHATDARRHGAELAFMLFLPAIAVAAAFQVLGLPYQGRYLLVLWLPLTIMTACGLSMFGHPLARVVATTSFCALSLAIGVATAVIPRFSGREDTADPARSLGMASTPRLIAIDQQWDVLPFELYRPQARRYSHASVTVRELDLVAMPARGFPAGSDADPPAPPRIAGLPKEMTLRQVIRGGSYVVERYAARVPVKLSLTPSGQRFPPGWRFFYERAGARPSGL